MSKTARVDTVKDLPESIAAIEGNLTGGALHINRGGLGDPACWFPIARASRRATALESTVGHLRVPADWRKREDESYATLRPNLAKYLHETGGLWEELQEQVRYGLRTYPPSKSPEAKTTVKRIRRIRDLLRRERYWLVDKLRGPVGRASGPRTPPGGDNRIFEKSTLRGVYTVDSLPPELEERVYVPASSEESTHAGFISGPDYLRTRQYRVWFGTSRSVTGTTPTHSIGAPALTLGSCLVYVPKTHEFGSLGSSWVSRVLKRLVGRNADDRVQLRETTALEPSVFKVQVSAELAKWRRRTALVVVHGYNIGFDEAARRTAQIGFDLRVDGVTTFFSWPSRGRLLRYMHDEEAIQAAEPHFVEFLKTIGQIPEVEEIDILAHSMGNRLLFSTVDRLIEAHQAGTLRARIGQVILAAADVAAPLFSPRAPSYRRLATRRITSYSCKQDLALRISRQLHGHSRVGLEPPVFVCPGIDSVSAAELDLHALGHSYYAETQTVVYDIADLIHNDTPPETRMRLEPSSSRLYWILR